MEKLWSRITLGVSNGLCEHLLIFASTSSCQIFLASSEHFRKIKMAGSENFEYFVNFPLAGISLVLIGYVVLRQVIANNLAHTSKTEQQMQNWGSSTSYSILQPIVPSACLVTFLYGKQPLLWPLLSKKKIIPLCTFFRFHTHLEEN